MSVVMIISEGSVFFTFLYLMKNNVNVPSYKNIVLTLNISRGGLKKISETFSDNLSPPVSGKRK